VRRDLAGHSVAVAGLAFSPDGVLLASASSDRSVWVQEVTTGRRVKELTGFGGVMAHDVAFSPDGRVLAASDWGGTLHFFEVGSWERLAELEARDPLGENSKIWSIAFDGRGRHFAAAGDDGIGLWLVENRGTDGTTGGRLALRPLPVPAEALRRNDPAYGRSVRLGPDGGRLAWLDISNGVVRVHLWDLAHDRVLPAPPSPARFAINNAAFSPDGRSFIYVNNDAVVVVWDVDAGRTAFTFGGGELAGAGSGAMSGHFAISDDGLLFAMSYQRTVTVWDAARRSLLFALPEQGGTVWSLAWSPDRRLLAVGSSDGGPTVWDLSIIRSELATIGLEW
jgi:dipeptidyl aminopeptidase/acylaminoacyl peptidase